MVEEKNSEDGWNTEDEIVLFDCICDFKPVGKNKQSHLTSLVEKLNEKSDSNKGLFTPEIVWDKLATLYDLARLEKIELQEESASDEPENNSNGSHEEDSSGLSDVEAEAAQEDGVSEHARVTRASSRPLSKSLHPEENEEIAKVREKKVESRVGPDGDKKGHDDEEEGDDEKDNVKEDNGENGDNGDVEEEEEEEEQVEQEEDEDEEGVEDENADSTSKRSTRGSRRHHQPETSSILPKKRTRSIAKLDAVETPARNRRTSKASTPPTNLSSTTPQSKRKKKPENNIEQSLDRPITRRSARGTSSTPAAAPAPPPAPTPAPPVRRSSRKK